MSFSQVTTRAISLYMRWMCSWAHECCYSRMWCQESTFHSRESSLPEKPIAHGWLNQHTALWKNICQPIFLLDNVWYQYISVIWKILQNLTRSRCGHIVLVHGASKSLMADGEYMACLSGLAGVRQQLEGLGDMLGQNLFLIGLTQRSDAI